MSRANASGYRLKSSDAPLIMGMIARGDRDHDIAAWFGVNQGRVASVKDGTKFGIVAAAHSSQLPPKGPPGIKGRRLRADMDQIDSALQSGDLKKAMAAAKSAIAKYDKNEA